MTRLLLRLAFPLALACFILPAPLPRGQLPEGVTREQMWRAPTAEEWKKPCLINWQRTWEDAVAISKETGKPILICINMDGEIASEHYAGIRYRQPEITKLYEPYVTVIASVYRHRPSDHDEHGHRLPCPRFGGVTCGEHIAIEPFLFEKFMDGKRIAPRHIMIELDGKETYDVFYAWDTDSVFKAVSDGITNRDQSLLKNVVRGDRSIIERVASKDSTDAGGENGYQGVGAEKCACGEERNADASHMRSAGRVHDRCIGKDEQCVGVRSDGGPEVRRNSMDADFGWQGATLRNFSTAGRTSRVGCSRKDRQA